MSYVKRGTSRELAWEAAGLRWLGDADAVAVAPVVALSDTRLEISFVSTTAPTREHAEKFGRDLAALHAAASAAFGAGPDGWAGDGYLGPSDDLLPLPLQATESWGGSYAAQLRAVADVATARRRLPPEIATLVARVAERLESGALDDGTAPARVHGDLWAGNVLWSRDGAVLIDPAAHVGHPQLDLALLELFRAPHLESILAAYDEAARLPDGWRGQTSLHQALHLLLHVACFGASYVRRTADALRPWA